ncbi:MAG: hypothetical protein ACRED5_18875 [Propylenella sp.]
MLDALTGWLADPVVRGWYLTFGFALMILPMLVLALWYHRTIRATEGGRALMRRQMRHSPSRFRPNIGEGLAMARDIEAGRYGPEAKAAQHRVYWFCGAWVVALTIAFGLLLYADEVNRAAAP